MAMASAALTGKHRSSSLTKQSVYKAVSNFFVLRNSRYVDKASASKTAEALDTSSPVSYSRPRGLDVLCKELPFSKEEIKLMYHSFKQECPSGVMSEDAFVDVYSRFFAPEVNSQRYAKHLYRVMHYGRKDGITFEQFMNNLMIVERKSIRERFHFMFNLYDVKNSGVITKDEVTEIVESVYYLAGWNGEDNEDIKEHVDEVFAKFDINGDGEVSMEEFVYICLHDEMMKESVVALRTV